MIENNLNQSNRYAFGGVLYMHKGKPVTTSIGSAKWDTYYLSLMNQNYDLGSVPPEVAHRPDLISNIWTGTPHLWWQVLCINGLFDPFESLNAGDPILVPHL